MHCTASWTGNRLAPPDERCTREAARSARRGALSSQVRTQIAVLYVEPERLRAPHGAVLDAAAAQGLPLGLAQPACGALPRLPSEFNSCTTKSTRHQPPKVDDFAKRELWQRLAARCTFHPSADPGERPPGNLHEHERERHRDHESKSSWATWYTTRTQRACVLACLVLLPIMTRGCAHLQPRRQQ